MDSLKLNTDTLQIIEDREVAEQVIGGIVNKDMDTATSATVCTQCTC